MGAVADQHRRGKAHSKGKESQEAGRGLERGEFWGPPPLWDNGARPQPHRKEKTRTLTRERQEEDYVLA